MSSLTPFPHSHRRLKTKPFNLNPAPTPEKLDRRENKEVLVTPTPITRILKLSYAHNTVKFLGVGIN